MLPKVKDILMRQQQILFCLALITLTMPMHARRLTSLSQSFLFTRPAYDNLGAREALWDQASYGAQETCLNGIQASAFATQSISSSQDGQYFMFDKKNKLIVGGSDHADRDVLLTWLDSSSTETGFREFIEIKPKTKQYGAMLQLHHCLGQHTSFKLFKRLWLEMSAPFTITKNDLQLTASQTLTDLFNRADLTAAKLSPTERSKTNIAEVIVQLGTSFINNDNFLLSTRTGVGIPTAGSPDSTYTFNPVMGPNGHFSLISNINAQLPLTKDDANGFVGIVGAVQQRYYLPNKQYRVLDLDEKPWSRYLQFRKEGETATVPGVKILNQYVTVDPYNHIDLYAGMRFKRGGAQMDLGYNLWVHPTEQITLAKDGNDTFTPDFTLYGIAGSTSAKSASASTIKTLAIDDTGGFIVLKEADIDLASGASQGTSLHRISASIGAKGKHKDTAGFGMISIFYEAPYNWANFHQWGAWFKMGVTW
jgi:hypothetical protein